MKPDSCYVNGNSIFGTGINLIRSDEEPEANLFNSVDDNHATFLAKVK